MAEGFEATIAFSSEAHPAPDAGWARLASRKRVKTKVTQIAAATSALICASTVNRSGSTLPG